MKTNTLTLCLLLFSLSIFSQNNPDGDVMLSQRQLAEIDFPNLTEGEAITLSAGDDIEGDYIGEMKFTRDGSEVWVLNRTTDNITVIDWASQSIVQNIPVGAMPMDIDFSDDLAVVACYGSNEAYFINLSDYSVAEIISVTAQPAKVDVSTPGNFAVIGCDEANVAEVIDLNTLSYLYTLNGFEVYLSKFSFITSNPRNSVYYSNFRITDDELYLINGADVNGMKFWELASGALVTNLPEAGDCEQIELSLDGQKVIGMQSGNPGIVSQVDIATQALISQVEIPGASIFSTYSPPAVNSDGRFCLVPTNPGNTTLVDFENETWENIETGNTPDWVGRSTDGNYLFAGDFYIAVIDPELASIESSLNGISIQNGAIGAGNRVVASDPLRYESLNFYEFENPNDLNITGTSTTGSEFEADATYAVKITPDGEKVLAINSLSGTLSVIDAASESVEAIIPLGSSETFQVDVTSDARYALIAKRLENEVSIVDLESMEVIAEVPSGGSKPDQVFVLPGDEYAYAINAGGGDNIGVIKLDGENSDLETTFSIGNTGISWTNFGIRSDLKFTSDGTHALLANPFDEQVQVIDLEEHEVVETIEVEGFPLQIAVAPDQEFGNFAAVTLKNSGEMAILAGEGNSWSLVEKHTCANNPVRVEYDPSEHMFWVVSTEEGVTQQFSIESMQFVGNENFNVIQPISLRYANGGRRFTLTRSSDVDATAHRVTVSTELTSESYDLPALPIHHFDITNDGTLAAIPHPSSDEVTLLKEEPLGYRISTLSLTAAPYLLFPNPVSETLSFQLKENEVPMANLTFRLFNLEGKLMFEKQITGGDAFYISRKEEWPSGNYIYELKSEANFVQSGKIILN